MTVYDATESPVRADLADAIDKAWGRLAQPGTWWTGEERIAIAAETGVPCGTLLTAFAEAVLGEDDAALRAARAALRERLGDAALVDAAAMVASYNSVVKVADATGIPLDAETAEETADLRADLGSVLRSRHGLRRVDRRARDCHPDR